MHEPFHKTSLENICVEVSESECKSDVPTNVFLELKHYEYIETSVSVKGAIYLYLPSGLQATVTLVGSHHCPRCPRVDQNAVGN